MNAIAEILPAGAVEQIRTMDDMVTAEARRIHADFTVDGKPWSRDYKEATLRGAYDGDEVLVALRTAIRRGIEIARAVS